MKVLKTKFSGLKIIQQKKNSDNRGSLRETYRKNIVKWDELVFDYATSSKKNVLRGFHFQHKFLQAKFVTVLRGKILDCVIDLRKGSKTFGKSYKIELSEKNCKSLLIPAGFAHGFLALDKENIIFYGNNNYRSANSEVTISWDDPSVNIKWPSGKKIISNKDKSGISFKEFVKKI